jgi:flagellar assembly factor FliW
MKRLVKMSKGDLCAKTCMVHSCVVNYVTPILENIYKTLMTQQLLSSNLWNLHLDHQN